MGSTKKPNLVASSIISTLLRCLLLLSSLHGVLSAPSVNQSPGDYLGPNARLLTEEEIDAQLDLQRSIGNTNLLNRLYGDYRTEASRNITKRGAESSPTCWKKDLYRNTPKGRKAVLLYHWKSAQCANPHRSNKFTVRCGSYWVNKNGEEMPGRDVVHEGFCSSDQYCFDRVRAENGDGDYDDQDGFSDIGCMRKERRGQLQAMTVRTSRTDPVEQCTTYINPLDERFARHPGTKHTTHRKFLLTAEAVCGTKRCDTLELYILEHSPGLMETVSSKDDAQNVQTVLEIEATAKRYWQACVKLAARYQLVEYTIFWVLYEMDHEFWKRDLDGPDNLTMESSGANSSVVAFPVMADE